ncbi:MAG: hypothetical protein ACQESR_18590, partial [Planctomycetota bacterium]
EICGHQIKYDFVLEKTGLETRPTYTVCNVRVDHVASTGRVAVHGCRYTAWTRSEHGCHGLGPWSVTFHATDGEEWCACPVCSGERELRRDKPVAFAPREAFVQDVQRKCERPRIPVSCS